MTLEWLESGWLIVTYTLELTWRAWTNLNTGFEYASQPGISDKEKEDRLHFVVVGGGPTVSSVQ